MVKIKLRRMGKKKEPTFRVIVIDERKAPKSSYIESLGFYNPRSEPPLIKVDMERLEHWLSMGAQPTESVKNIIKKLKAKSKEVEA
ncbi:MAG TPA: 30S ribosomal protein S16 [Firmicutes bacterium]|nr:30S ribosomal protein S16 [Bacillota bacterium]